MFTLPPTMIRLFAEHSRHYHRRHQQKCSAGRSVGQTEESEPLANRLRLRRFHHDPRRALLRRAYGGYTAAAATSAHPHPCPSVVVPSRSWSETPIGLILNRRPGSSGRLNVSFLIRVIREIRGERPRLHRTHFTTVFPTSACSVGHLDPFRALGVFRGSPISSHRVSAVSFRLHLSAPSATSAVNSGEIRNNLQRSHRRHGPRRAAAATPAHPHPCPFVSIRGCPLAELFGNADRRG